MYSICYNTVFNCVDRNYLVRLKFDDLDVIEVLPWLPDNYTTSLCLAKGQHEVVMLSIMFDHVIGIMQM